jgi:hypothetical protein
VQVQKLKYLAVAAILAPFFLADQSRSEESKTDVQSLYSSCKTPRDLPDAAFCAGFVTGLGSQMRITEEFARVARGHGGLTDDNTRRFISVLSVCGEQTFGQMVSAFIKWVEKHPEKRSLNRTFGLEEALREAWPCAVGQ